MTRARTTSRMRRTPTGRVWLFRRGAHVLHGSDALRVERVWRRLDAGAYTVPELVAAQLAADPAATDEVIARRVRGVHDPAIVARVRGNVAAGRPPGHGLAQRPPTVPGAPSALPPAVWVPPVPTTPPPVPQAPPPGPPCAICGKPIIDLAGWCDDECEALAVAQGLAP